MADTLDILSFDEMKDAIKLSANRASEAENAATQANTAVSRLLDDVCGPIVVRTITGEILDAPCGDLYTRESPLYSVTSLKEYSTGTATTLAAETLAVAGTYRIIGTGHGRRIQRRSSWNPYSWTGQIEITYVAGRYADTASVDAKFKKAAAEILQGNWTKFAAAWARGGDGIADPIFFDEVSNIVSRWLPYERKPSATA